MSPLIPGTVCTQIGQANLPATKPVASSIRPITALLANLGKSNSKLCPFSTPFDEKLSQHVNSYFSKQAEIYRGCGLPGEPSCENLEKKANFHRKKIYALSQERNDYLRKIGPIPISCFVTLKEIRENFGSISKITDKYYES